MIAYGMLYAAAVGLPLFLATGLLAGLRRRRGKAERGVWTAGLLLALFLPVVALLAPPPAIPVPMSDAAPTTLGPETETGLVGLPTVVVLPATPTVAVPASVSPFGFDHVVTTLWLLASLTLALRWAVASLRLSRWVRSWPPVRIDGLRVRLTDDVGPAVAGVVRPRILVPSWLVSMPRRQRSLVLLHEGEHVRARDPVLVALARVCRVAVPWNPFVWLFTSRLYRAIELDCDRRVLRRRPDVRAYGAALLDVSARDTAALAGAAAFAESEAPLRTRILAMTTPPRPISIVSLLATMALGVVLLLGVFEVPIPSVHMQLDVEPAATSTLTEMSFPVAAAEPADAPDVVTTGTVEGVVRDQLSGRPIAEVQVYVLGRGIGGLTDAEGRFALSGIPVGVSEVRAHRIGYGDATHRIRLDEGDRASIDLRLRETAVSVDGLVVGPRSRPGPGIALPRVASMGEREPIVYVDGVRIASPIGPETSHIEQLRATYDIERVEIIKAGAAAALYGEEASGGVIQIYTKSAEAPARGTPERPVFTPFSLAPEILNLEEVRRALAEAYPEELRAEGVGGRTQLYFYIDESGVVRDTRVHESSGHAALDRAAIDVAARYRFSPALNRDRPVAVWVAFPVTFFPFHQR